MRTTNLYNIIRSELLKKGFNEFINEEGELIFYEDHHQFMNKILTYDDDVSSIIDSLFLNLSLSDKENDSHFKRSFTLRFMDRQINRQTIDAFKSILGSTFLIHENHLNMIYSHLEQFIKNESGSAGTHAQQNNQQSDGSSITDNRQAFADLPQNKVNLDVDKTTMEYASDNTISRNKESNNQNSLGETSGQNESKNYQYSIATLEKANVLLDDVMNRFDKKCFLQVW